jgi:hypothetical protein
MKSWFIAFLDQGYKPRIGLLGDASENTRYGCNWKWGVARIKKLILWEYLFKLFTIDM